MLLVAIKYQICCLVYSKDAILVNCKISAGETCIIPKPERVHKKELYKQGTGHVWLSEMDQGSLVSAASH